MDPATGPRGWKGVVGDSLVSPVPWASTRRREMEELNKTPNFCPSVQSASHLCISLSHFLDGQVEPQSPKKNFPGCRPAGPSVSCRAAHTHRAYHGERGELSAAHLPPSTASNPRPPGTRLWTRRQLPPSRPAKSRVSRNRRGCRGPGASELLRVRRAAPAPVPTAHSRPTCGRWRHAAAPASSDRNPRGRAEWEARLPGGKFCADSR